LIFSEIVVKAQIVFFLRMMHSFFVWKLSAAKL